MRSKSILTGLVLAVFTLFVAGGVVEAKKGKGGSNGSTDTRFEADLQGPDAEGNSERRTQTKNNAIKDDRFTATVDIPMPNGLGIDANNASGQDIRLILTHGVADYAVCLLVFDGIQQDLTTGQFEAEYKLDLRAKKSASKGSCHDSITGALIGLPAVQDGDLATVTQGATEILQGKYVQH